MVLYRPIRHPQLSFLGVITIVYNPYPFRHEKTFMFSCALGSKGLYCCYSTFFLRGLSFNHPSLSLKWMDFFGWGWLHVTKKKHWDFTSVWAATGTPSAASEKRNGRAYGRGAGGSAYGSWLVHIPGWKRLIPGVNSSTDVGEIKQSWVVATR